MIKEWLEIKSLHSWKVSVFLLLGAIFSTNLAILLSEFTTTFKLFSLPVLVSLNSIIIVHVILICTHFCYLSINNFPGSRPKFVAIPILLFFTLISFALILFLRIDYSRLVLGSGLLGLGCWYVLFSVIIRKLVKARLGLVPAGRTFDLHSIKSVECIQLKQHELSNLQLDGIVFDHEFEYSDEWRSFLIKSQLNGIIVYDLDKAKEMLTGRVASTKDAVKNIPTFAKNRIYIYARNVLDKIVAILALPFVLLAILIAAIAIKIDDGGPIFFTQDRTGHKTKKFTIYKLRTMTDENVNYVLNGGENHNVLRKDITRVGKFLRKSRIDETPQIFNVLFGQMAWIGPRPNTLKLSNHYRSEFAEYDLRYAIRPGITGWAQVNFRHVSTVDEEIEKVSFDLYYVKNISLQLDLLIAYKTIKVILTGAGAR